MRIRKLQAKSKPLTPTRTINHHDKPSTTNASTTNTTMTNQESNFAQKQQQLPGYYNLQPQQPTAPAEEQFSIVCYPPAWFAIPVIVIASFFARELEGILMVAGLVGILWAGCLIWPARLRCMNVGWSVVLVVLTVLTAACVADTVYNWPDALKENYYQV